MSRRVLAIWGERSLPFWIGMTIFEALPGREWPRRLPSVGFGKRGCGKTRVPARKVVKSSIPQGLKARVILRPFTARLKSCPFKTRSFSAAHELHSAAKRGCSLLFPWNPECSVPTEEQTQILRLRLRMTVGHIYSAIDSRHYLCRDRFSRHYLCSN